MRADKLIDRTTAISAPASGIPEILELPRHAGNPRVESIERHAARLTQHLGGSFRIAERLVGKRRPCALTWRPPSVIAAQVIRILCGVATEPCP